MNFPRVAAAAVVAWVVSIALGFFINTVLLADLTLANAAAMRPEAQIMGLLPVGFVFLLVGFFAFAYAYAKGYEGGNGVMEGLRFGVLVAIVVCAFGLIWQWILYPISGAYVTAIMIDAIVEMAIYGAIVGAIYRPAGVAA